MKPYRFILSFLLIVWLPIAMGCQNEQAYDIVIRNGRVMDPETGRDEVADVAIKKSKIVAIGVNLGSATVELEAEGMVVAPGFVDILATEPANLHAHTHKVTDGVTTSLGMHGGPVDLDAYRRKFEESGALLNYGATVGHRRLRQAVDATDGTVAATPEQVEAMQLLADKAIKAGAIGIGFGINYTPGVAYEEIYALFEVAAKNQVPCHLHARYKGNVFPFTMSLAAQEVIAMAAATGVQAQLVHLTSSTVGAAPLTIKLIEGAAKHGVDVGFDFHVWKRNMTYIQSALYDPGWQERFGGVTYSDIYLVETQERLTKERFEELRATPGYTLVQTQFIPEEEIEMAIRSPIGIISSDGAGLWSKKGHERETGHPRSTGTFSRFLGKYVRERKIVDLMEGLRKITLLPAQRMEKTISAMKQKGRLQVGRDADITVFDANTIAERATYQKPYLYSEGIKHVLINGVVVLNNGEIVPGVKPGRWMRHIPGS